jgi:hypothetical protein
MPRRCDEIEPLSGEAPERFTPGQAMGRTLEAAHPKALED